MARRPVRQGSFGCKKEIQFARIRRARRNGVVQVEVGPGRHRRVEGIRQASGRWQRCRGARKAGPVRRRRHRLDPVRGRRRGGRAEPGADRTASRCATLGHNIGYERLCAGLDALAEECEAELAGVFAALVEHCAQLMSTLKRKRGASCASCRFFHPAIGESKRSPAEAAECGHPRYYALLTANKAFPFEHGCRF